ncbi:MAG: hypothetical protein Q4E62_04060 [Sutterellaceae bacterium]|nr:hypothetical protein [Sutterellaceae bacterium]
MHGQIGFWKISVLVLAAWVTMVAVFEPGEIKAQINDELAMCSNVCSSRVERVRESVAECFATFEKKLVRAIYAIPTEGLGDAAYEGLFLAVIDPNGIHCVLETVSALFELFAVRVAALVSFLKVLVVLIVAGVVDAVSLRKIASVSFRSAKPVVSDWALTGAKLLPRLGVLVLFVPFGNMQLAAVTVWVAAMVSLTVWLRHFHRFER